MKLLYQLKCPDEVEASITISATVKEFKQLREILDKNPTAQHYPHGSLRSAISDVIRASTEHFAQEAKDGAL